MSKYDDGTRGDEIKNRKKENEKGLHGNFKTVFDRNRGYAILKQYNA